VLSTANLPRSFKSSKVISILKPGKDGSDPAHSRPFALLSVVFELLVRLNLQRIQPLIEENTLINQVGFREPRS
jgi:hypothetical protein